MNEYKSLYITDFTSYSFNREIDMSPQLARRVTTITVDVLDNIVRYPFKPIPKDSIHVIKEAILRVLVHKGGCIVDFAARQSEIFPNTFDPVTPKTIIPISPNESPTQVSV